MLRRNRPVMKFVKSVEFVEEVGFEPGVKDWGVMDVLATQPLVSKHWSEHKALTSTHDLASVFIHHQMQELTLQEWTMMEEIAGVDFAGLDNDTSYSWWCSSIACGCLSAEILSVAAQLYKILHLKRLAVGKCPWRSLKVISNGAIW